MAQLTLRSPIWIITGRGGGHFTWILKTGSKYYIYDNDDGVPTQRVLIRCDTSQNRIVVVDVRHTDQYFGHRRLRRRTYNEGRAQVKITK